MVAKLPSRGWILLYPGCNKNQEWFDKYLPIVLKIR